MSSMVETRIKQSSQAFVSLVWPHIKDDLGGGVLVPVEGVTDESMAQTFDTVAGIDAWQVLDNREGIRGIASRVQPTGKDWSTFTIRRRLRSGAETEWHKRMRAILGNREGLLYPAVTVQAYVHEGYNGPLLSVAYIRTRDLFHAAILHDWIEKPVDGGNTMLVLEWAKLKELGYRIKIVKATDGWDI